jgi:hypothetical protein
MCTAVVSFRLWYLVVCMVNINMHLVAIQVVRLTSDFSGFDCTIGWVFNYHITTRLIVYFVLKVFISLISRLSRMREQ